MRDALFFGPGHASFSLLRFAPLSFGLHTAFVTYLFTALQLPRVLYQRKCKRQNWSRFYLSSAGDEAVPILNGRTLSAQNFESKFLRPSRPCIIEGLADDWPALSERRWSFEKLHELYGGRYFECGKTGFDSDPIILSMTAFLGGLDYSTSCSHHNPGSTGNDKYQPPQYLFDATFDADCPELLLDYTVPHLFRGE